MRHQPSRHRIYSLPHVPQALRTLDRLERSELDELAKATSGREAFEVEPARCSSLAKQLKLEDPSEVATLLASLEFLYDRVVGEIEEDKDLDRKGALERILFSTGLSSFLGKDRDRLLSNLTRFVEENPFHEQKQKDIWLTTGIIPSARSFASFVDLRPDVDEARENITKWHCVVIFSATAETDEGRDERLVFQMTPTDLMQLKRAVEDAERKVALLQRAPIMGKSR